MAMELRRNNARPADEQQGAVAQRSPLGDWLGFDPLNVFRNFYRTTQSLDFGIDVAPTDEGYLVEIPVAGFKPDQVEVTYKDGYVSISGKSDRRSLNRSLMLPDDVDPERIDARVEHGLLTLDLKRHPAAQPKKIPIR